MDKTIDKFYGEYRWLSNFWACHITIQWSGNVIHFPAKSVEHGYQALKARFFDDFVKILWLESPGKAKRYARNMAIRPDWESVKISIMRDLIRQKFSDKNPELKKLLIDTNDIYLIEGNNWHDNFWGVCSCNSIRCKKQSLNWLGQILMETRDELSSRSNSNLLTS